MTKKLAKTEKLATDVLSSCCLCGCRLVVLTILEAFFCAVQNVEEGSFVYFYTSILLTDFQLTPASMQDGRTILAILCMLYTKHGWHLLICPRKSQ